MITTRSGCLLGVLLLAGMIRFAAMMTQTYVIFPDETFQYLEQGHRLAFGDGIVPWEYHDGIRSWLLPAVLAALMRAGTLLAEGPQVYLWLIRGACILLSLSVVWVGFRMGERRGGLALGLFAGLLGAVWFDLVWFAPVVLTETVAAHLVILAIGLADGSTMSRSAPADTAKREPDPTAGHPRTTRALLAAGACLGLAACLRYQYSPVIAVIALWQFRLSWSHWRPALIGGVVVTLLGAGVLDWVTWGAPFQSIWLHFLRNTMDGVGSAMGTNPPIYYLAYLIIGLWPAPILLPLAVLGTTRAPSLGLAALVTLLVHTAVPHKEVRFIYLALAVAPILIAFGTAAFLERMGGWRPVWIAALFTVWAGLSWHGATQSGLAARWSFNRPAIEAFLAASRLPDLCGLAVRDMRLIDSGGYVYLHRDVPLFFADSASEITLPGSGIGLRFSVERGRRPEPLRSIPTQGGYNTLIANATHGEAGFARLACFDGRNGMDGTTLCLFHDPRRSCN